MKILITGGNGFVGQYLTKHFQSFGYDVTTFTSGETDLTINGSLNNYSAIKFDRIYHLAAWTQAGDFCLYHPGEQWIINQKINSNVLEWWQDQQQQASLIAMGTSCSYDPSLPLFEDNYLKGMPEQSLFTYAMTKRMLQVGLQALSKQYSMKYQAYVPSTIYGPGYHTDGRQMHFIFDLIRKIIRGKRRNEKVVLWGDGEQRRELIFIEDFIKNLDSLSTVVDSDLVNVGSGNDYSIKQFAEMISVIVGYDHNDIEYDLTKYVGVRNKRLEIAKMKSLIGHKLQNTSVEVGLQKTIDWFEQMGEKAGI
jgi:GDP-L-fucose synthase